MSEYLPELIRQLEETHLKTEIQEFAVAFQIEGADKMHHGIEFIVREIVDDFESLTDEERVTEFIIDVAANYEEYVENHSELVQKHSTAVDEAFEEYA